MRTTARSGAGDVVARSAPRVGRTERLAGPRRMPALSTWPLQRMDDRSAGSRGSGLPALAESPFVGHPLPPTNRTALSRPASATASRASARPLTKPSDPGSNGGLRDGAGRCRAEPAPSRGHRFRRRTSSSADRRVGQRRIVAGRSEEERSRVRIDVGANAPLGAGGPIRDGLATLDGCLHLVRQVADSENLKRAG